MNTATDNTTTAPAIVLNPGQFNGALSKFQVAAYGSMVRFGLDKHIAHKVAQDFGADMGNAMRNDDKFAAKVGKAKKDGDSVIKFSGKGSTLMTNSMSVVRTAQVIEGLADEEIISGSPVLSQMVWSANVADYIEDAELWAKSVEWSR